MDETDQRPPLAVCDALARDPALRSTDDTAARLAARNLSIRAHGTLGILLRAIRRGQRSRDELIEVLR